MNSAGLGGMNYIMDVVTLVLLCRLKTILLLNQGPYIITIGPMPAQKKDSWILRPHLKRLHGEGKVLGLSVLILRKGTLLSCNMQTCCYCLPALCDLFSTSSESIPTLDV